MMAVIRVLAAMAVLAVLLVVGTVFLMNRNFKSS